MVRKVKQTKKAQAGRRAYRKKHHQTIHRKKKRVVRRVKRTKAYRARGGKPKAFKYVLRAGKLRYAGKA